MTMQHGVVGHLQQGEPLFSLRATLGFRKLTPQMETLVNALVRGGRKASLAMLAKHPA